MNILVIGRDHVEGFARYVTNALKSMGHRSSLFDPLPKLSIARPAYGAVWAKATNAIWPLYEKTEWAQMRLSNSLLAAAAKMRSVDLAICCFDFLYPANASTLKKATGCKLALWFPDHIANFGKHAFLSAPYDALFFKDPFIVRRLKATLDRPVFYLPEAYEPIEFDDQDLAQYSKEEYGCDICVAGNLYPYRIAFFEQLAGYNVRIWGNPAPAWADDRRIRHMVQGRFIAGKEKIAAFRLAKIVLNNLHPAEIEGVNVRTFEAAGAGAFQMVDRRPAIAQLSKENVEIVTFADVEELHRKITQYLDAPAEREAIAAAGRRRAHTDHTYEKRLSLLLEATETGHSRGLAMS
jgi:spore maturation protein CgeB